MSARRADQAVVEVDVFPPERHEFAASQSGVEGRRPECPVVLRRSRDQRGCLLWGRDPVAAASNRGKLDPGGGVQSDFAAAERPSVDRDRKSVV